MYIITIIDNLFYPIDPNYYSNHANCERRKPLRNNLETTTENVKCDGGAGETREPNGVRQIAEVPAAEKAGEQLHVRHQRCRRSTRVLERSLTKEKISLIHGTQICSRRRIMKTNM
ncbi:hypothetical protein YC2023_094418 [Brassica napus]